MQTIVTTWTSPGVSGCRLFLVRLCYVVVKPSLQWVVTAGHNIIIDACK